MGYMKVSNKNTGEVKGYLAADAVQNVMLVPTKDTPNENLCNVYWLKDEQGRLWLDSGNAAFQKRQLGLGSANIADWGIPSPGGWREPLIYNADKTISMVSAPHRFLCYPEGQGECGSVYWSHDGNDPTILVCEMEE